MTTKTHDNYRLLMVGVPATGKTSFLAALWHLVESDLPGKSWHQYKYGPDIEYMNRIRRRWLDCQQQDRTIQETVDSRNVELFLKDERTNHCLTLSVPDIEGEQFTQQWITRSWSESYDQMVRTANGLLFFLNPNKVKPAVHLSDTSILIGGFIEPKDEAGGMVNWQPDLAPTQVIAVDLLQFHLPILSNPKLASVAIIISAWDTVLELDDTLTPTQWLTENMPLLYQYLKANEDKVKFAVFGVSAQGGDYSQQAIQHKLAEMEEPAQRVVIQEQNTQHHNLMAPIEWSMQAWQ